MIVTTYHAKYHGQSMILGEKSYSDRRNRGQSSCQSCRVRVIFLLASRFVGIHDFDIPLRGGDTLVRHDALYGADVRSGSCL